VLFYFVKSPFWLKNIYPNLIWDISTQEKKLFLTFDDGPHPIITIQVLDLLKAYNAKATFFCIGNNVVKYPEVYKRIIDEGHSVGNHTFNHLNGWKTDDELYLNDINKAMEYIDSNLFRPPYGRISRFQIQQLLKPKYQMKMIMWSVLSGDFDRDISAEKCLNNVLLSTKAGSIIVFHDSEKAAEKMLYALPKVLEQFSKKGFSFEKITDMALKKEGHG
jgi:peptidoglycan/xylan/chitin deacetylase (PgdA/CDA1 family)